MISSSKWKKGSMVLILNGSIYRWELGRYHGDCWESEWWWLMSDTKQGNDRNPTRISSGTGRAGNGHRGGRPGPGPYMCWRFSLGFRAGWSSCLALLVQTEIPRRRRRRGSCQLQVESSLGVQSCVSYGIMGTICSSSGRLDLHRIC